jgi:hypothetical protein
LLLSHQKNFSENYILSIKKFALRKSSKTIKLLGIHYFKRDLYSCSSVSEASGCFGMGHCVIASVVPDVLKEHSSCERPGTIHSPTQQHIPENMNASMILN